VFTVHTLETQNGPFVYNENETLTLGSSKCLTWLCVVHRILQRVLINPVVHRI